MVKGLHAMLTKQSARFECGGHRGRHCLNINLQTHPEIFLDVLLRGSKSSSSRDKQVATITGRRCYDALVAGLQAVARRGRIGAFRVGVFWRRMRGRTICCTQVGSV
jgi:hypothetical protein